MATLFHQASFMRLGSKPIEILLTLAAVAVLLLPRRVAPFCALLAIQLVEILHRAPAVSNHWWMSGFVSLTLLVTLIASTRGGFSYARWRGLFVRPLRAILIIVYVYGVFHKINTDFLDPEISCGIDLYRTLAEKYLTFLPQGELASWFSIIGTLVVESAIPLLLLFKSTRAYGVVLGVGFHFFLGFVPYSVYYNFSSALFVLFWLWIEPEQSDRILHESDLLARLRAWRWPLVLAWLAFLAVGSTKVGGGKQVWRHLYRVPWFVYGSVCLAGAVSLAKRGGVASSKSAGARATPSAPAWVYLFPFLFLLHSLDTVRWLFTLPAKKGVVYGRKMRWQYHIGQVDWRNQSSY